MKLRALGFLGIVLFIVGCQKELDIVLDDGSNPPSITDSLLDRIEYKNSDGDSAIQTYTYDASNRLKKFVYENYYFQTATKDIEYWYEFNRDANGSIIRVKAGYPLQMPTDTVYIRDYYYQDDRCIYSFRADEVGNAVSDTIKYTYNSNGWLASRKVMGSLDGNPWEEIFETDAKGNILSRKLYSDNGSGMELDLETQIEYDDKKSPGDFVAVDLVPLIESEFADYLCTPANLLEAAVSSSQSSDTYTASIIYGSDHRPRILDWTLEESLPFVTTTSGMQRYFYRAR